MHNYYYVTVHVKKEYYVGRAIMSYSALYIRLLTVLLEILLQMSSPFHSGAFAYTRGSRGAEIRKLFYSHITCGEMFPYNNYCMIITRKIKGIPARVTHQRSDTMYSRTVFPGVRLLHTENVALLVVRLYTKSE